MSRDEHRIALLTDQERNLARDWVISYFESERDERLGILASEEILDAFLESIGPVIYNRALADAKVWLARRVEDMEVDYEALRRSTRGLERS